MTSLIHKTGDLFSTHATAIGHGVNTAGVMGHGIAVLFRERFPQMFEAYNLLCRQGNLNPGETMAWQVPGGLFVYNIASQDQPGRNARIDWLRDGVQAALFHAEENGVAVLALPRIGSGIGGLDQYEVEQVLTELAAASPVDIEVWTLP